LTNMMELIGIMGMQPLLLIWKMKIFLEETKFCIKEKHIGLELLGLNTPFNPNDTLNIEDFIQKNGKMEYNVKEDYELDESEIKEVWKSEIEEEIKGKLIKF